MSKAQTLTRKVSELAPEEQIKLVDEILLNLHGTESRVLEKWAEISDSRVRSYLENPDRTVTWSEIQEKYGK